MKRTSTNNTNADATDTARSSSAPSIEQVVYFNMKEEELQAQSVIREKTYIFWTIFGIILFIGLATFFMLIGMICTIRTGDPVTSIEFIAGTPSITLFNNNATINMVLVEKPIYSSNTAFQMILHGLSVVLRISNSNPTAHIEKLAMNERGVTFHGIDNFKVIHPETKNTIFSEPSKKIELPEVIDHLHVKQIEAKRIVSLNKTLSLMSDRNLWLKGNERIRMKGGQVLMNADGDIYINTVEGGVHFLSPNIILKNLPIVNPFNLDGESAHLQQKICVCMPEGIVFTVPIVEGIRSSFACSFVKPTSPGYPCTK